MPAPKKTTCSTPAPAPKLIFLLNNDERIKDRQKSLFGQIDDKAEELFALAGALSYSRLKKMRHPRAQPFIACGVIDRKPTNVDRQRIYAVLAAHAHR